MIKKIKMLSFLFAGVLMFSLCMGINASASVENDYDFIFTIKPYQYNSRIDSFEAKYRNTPDPENMWKVGLRKSGEGEGTITCFWLEIFDETNVSDAIKAKQGTKTYYKEAYKSASEKKVYLTAENNNYNSDRYSVSGVWDEETGKYAG